MARDKADRDGKVMRGRDGWLFLAHDRNDVIAQHEGRRPLPPRRAERLVATFAKRAEVARRSRAAYVALIPPNAHSVYPEFLPEEVTSAEERPVHQLLAALAASAPAVRVVYPLAELQQAKAEHRVWCPTDSHWNARGAYVAYRALMAAAAEEGVTVPVVEEEAVEFHDETVTGDLGGKLTPPSKGTQTFARIREPGARLVSDNRIRNNGRLIELENPAAPDIGLLVFSDSYGYALLRFLAESFRRVTFAHLPVVDPDVVSAARPGLIVTVLNERFVRDAPDDRGSRGAFVAEVQRKLERVGVMSRGEVDRRGRKLGWP